jgi:uncharacterized membrane protein YdjX (TVP38/TMEM64 family)
LLLALILGAVAAFFLTGLHERLAPDGLRPYVAHWQQLAERHSVEAMAIVFGVYVGCASLSLPSSFALSLLAGALFGIVRGLALVSVAATLGACVAFLTTRYLFREAAEKRLGGRMARINAAVERDGAWYLLALRLTPVIPYFLINAAMGLTSMRLSTFAIVSWLGMLPVGLIIVNAGKNLGKIHSSADVFTFGVLGSLLLLAVVPLLLRYLMRRWVRDEAVG